MNLIVLSMEAGGASWLGAIISQMHYNFTRKKIFWNFEISRLIATDNRYYLPEGFSCVFYVNPLNLLKRAYDKVIILQRERETMINEICERNDLDNTPEEMAEYPDFFDKINFYYDLIYNTPITDKRVMRIQLEEINNYPVAIFSDLFDFLEYPQFGRPILIPLPVNRDWKKRSSILRKGHEEGVIEKDEYSQFVNVEKPNPFKFSPEEYHYQKGHVYRIKAKDPMVDTLEELGLL